jgi:hypothetical protein
MVSRWSVLVLAVLVLFGFSSDVLAYHPGSSSSKSVLSGKFFHKAHFLLSNEEELDLSEDQVESIKDLKLTVKKNIIQQDAEVEILALDIRSKLYGHVIDVDGARSLIEQKYALKQAKAMMLVQAIADVKALLSAEQYELMKDLWKSKN